MGVGRFLPYVLLFIIFAVVPLVGFYGDWLWFTALNYESLFLTVLYSKLILGVILTTIFFIVLFVNMRILKRFHKKERKFPWLTILVLVSLFIGLNFASGWETTLKFLNSTAFGSTDPIFGNDIGFYVFELPFYSFALTFLTILSIAGFLFTVGGHLLYAGIKRKQIKIGDDETGEIMRSAMEVDWLPKGKGISHIYFWAGVIFLVIAGWFFLGRFSVLTSESAALIGAGFTDLAVTIPFLTIMSGLAALIGIVFLANIRMHNLRLSKLLIGIFIGVLVLGGVAGILVQQIIVKPDEFNKESEFIGRNIDYTLQAFNLKDIDERPFDLSTDLTKEDIANNKGTIENVRILDWRPLLRTNNQLQVFRTYYDFEDVDIDRYAINGDYKQVMISPREVDINNLAPPARTWVNRHLVYTHGYGITMSPVERISKEGLPSYFVKDIPPVSTDFTITRPEIYYGQQTRDYVVTDTTTQELDYPQGDTNIYTTYAGSGGIDLSGLNRLVYAIKFGSIELLLSESITEDSKILFNRIIEQRVRKVAPFLRYDSDPYIVLSDGKLFWLYDAYTVTDKYPYSQPVRIAGGDINYIRNSVKILVDAYSGEVTFYVIDTDDPIIQTYRKIFPDAFRDFSEMSEDLKTHVRYPEDLFKIQSSIYSLYHMKNPQVFYNKEDLWNVPQEIYRGSRQTVSPYYVIMKLPDKEQEEFIMLIPFTPVGKDNMIGWMAANSDAPDYGRITVFTFSKQELTFGPFQIEARIDQDTTISQQITLWDQSGSEVIRGNLLAIPIKNSILYVEPLYLQASGASAVPELKRVIVAFGDRLTMQKTFEEALDVMFGTATTPTTPSEPTDKTQSELIVKANDLYNRAQDALKQGDFTKYAELIDELGIVLGQL